MINFFRKIRQSLLTQGKTGKYLTYAVGEIVLVMIGILLALQVNEWNNERNRKKSEQVVIEQLITDLCQSQYELEEEIEVHRRDAREYARVLRSFWIAELPDNIEDHIRGFRSAVYSPVMGTAHSLINSGRLDILSSKELKNDIVSYAEVVGYTLKDINRYEESYFRSGAALLIESIPGSHLSKEALNERGKSSRWRWDYDNNLNSTPEFIDKVPFKTDPKKLFEDQIFFLANTKLHLYHRNISNRYNNILRRTNELLVKLYLASDKYQELGKQLADSEHYLVFDAADLEILMRADALLSAPLNWNKNTRRSCDDDITSKKYSLLCALITASEEVEGVWQDDPLRPAIRLVYFILKKYENRRVIGNRLREWNDHPDTTFEEVKMVLSECIATVETQIKSRES